MSDEDKPIVAENEPVDPKEIHSRKDRPTGSIHFGDDDFEVPEDYADATWKEVYEACCCHSPTEWGWVALGLFGVAGFLYFFLFGLDLLGTGAKVMSSCQAGSLFGDDTNPIAGLMVGILATVLLQSSSTTTSIIVSLVGDDSVLSVKQGIYMVMGANIGTSVTNTIVAIGQMGDAEQLERAFAGATVHDMFNFMSVAILLPLEVITGYLNHLTEAMVKNYDENEGETWEGPVGKYIEPLGKMIIIENKKVVENIANNKLQENGEPYSCNEGGGFYPIKCSDPNDDSSCKPGIIKCDSDLGCPAFFQRDASAKDDKVSGGVVFFIGIMIIFVCLAGLVTILQKMLLGMSTRVVYKATDVNGYVGIAIGAGITMIVQSSSITTSTLTPLVGMGVLRLEQMFPLTLGANIGTTLTGIMAALVGASQKKLQVALAHLFFNVTGILIFYPIPYMRKFPLNAARQLGKATRIWRGFPIPYIGVMFVLIPLLMLGLSSLFENDSKGLTVLGAFLVIILALIIAYCVYYWRFNDGKAKCITCLENREKRRMTLKELPEDMQMLKERVAALIQHTGLPVEEEEDEEKDVAPEEEASA